MRSFLQILRSREFLAGVAVLLALFIGISLLTWDYRDGDYYPKHEVAYNCCGRAGAVLAMWLYTWLGIVAYLVPCSILFLAFMGMGRNYSVWEWVTWIFCATLWIGWLCIFASFLEREPPQSYRMPSCGGIFGIFCIAVLRSHLGNTAAAAIVVCTALAWVLYGAGLFLEHRIVRKKMKMPK